MTTRDRSILLYVCVCVCGNAPLWRAIRENFYFHFIVDVKCAIRMSTHSSQIPFSSCSHARESIARIPHIPTYSLQRVHRTHSTQYHHHIQTNVLCASNVCMGAQCTIDVSCSHQCTRYAIVVINRLIYIFAHQDVYHGMCVRLL